MKGRLQTMLVLLVLIAGCPSFRGRDGIFHEAFLKDMNELYEQRGNKCNLDKREWQQRCVQDFAENPDDCPPDCPNVRDYEGL
jgi:hypothetical protein